MQIYTIAARVFLMLCGAYFVSARAVEAQQTAPATQEVAPIFAQPVFGTLQSDTARAAELHAAGVTLAQVGVAWNRFEPREGVWDGVYLGEVKAKIEKFRAAKQQIVLDLGVHYTPDWVTAWPNARFVNQYGVAYDASEPGKNVPNVVFNQRVRQAQSVYIARLLRELGGDFHHIRLGGGWYGELHYPPAQFGQQDNCYWAFDAIAQGRVPGLATGLRPCPVPDWKPGEASVNHRSASLFAAWYLEALANYHDWQIAAVRQSYAGPLAMMYPGWGVRPGQLDNAIAVDLDGSTDAEKNGEIQAGNDFARLVASIRDPNVIVYTTWIDAPFGDDTSRLPKEWTPAHWLSYLSAANPLNLATMGENTGGGDDKALQRSIKPMRDYGLQGLIWAFEPELFDGKHATLKQLAEATVPIQTDKS